MTDGERDKLHEMNGRLSGLEAAVKHFKSTWEHQDEEATASRVRLYDKFEELIRGVAGLTFRVDQMTNEVAALKASDINSNNRHQQAIGSKKTIALMWGAMLALISATAGAAVEIVHMIWPKAH